jgi:hypothetical protein
MKRIRIGLRLMLLLVALCAVLLAWFGALRERHRTNVRGELKGFEMYRDYAAKHRHIYTSEQGWRESLAEMDALIAERRKALGEDDH